MTSQATGPTRTARTATTRRVACAAAFVEHRPPVKTDAVPCLPPLPRDPPGRSQTERQRRQKSRRGGGDYSGQRWECIDQTTTYYHYHYYYYYYYYYYHYYHYYYR